MKVGDLVQMSKESIMCERQDQVVGCGVVLETPWPSHPVSAYVLWDDGEVELHSIKDMVIINESR